MHSLRTKITAVTVAAILASLLAAAVAGFFTVGQEMSNNSAIRMHLLSEVAQKSLDAYLKDIEQAVEITSQIATSSLDGMQLVECGANKAPEERTAEQTARLNTYLTAHVDALKEPFGNVASHTNGVVSYYYCIEPNLSSDVLGLFYTRTGKVGFEAYEPINVGALDPNDEEHNVWYFTTVRRGTPGWVGPYKDFYLGDALAISYLTPIYRSGVLVGVMGMDILLDTLVEQIKSLQVYSTGYACLIDANGQVLYHPEYGVTGIPDSESQVFGTNAFSKESSGNEAIRYNKDGEKWQMSYSTLSNGMKLVVTAPTSEVESSWNRLVHAVPFIGIVILALFIPLALYATGRIIKPLQQLTAGANRLSTGDYDIELDYHGDDEVGKLTDAFRHLREHLQVYTSNLSSSSFSDELTGVKNKQAFEMYAAQVNDAIVRTTDDDDTRFALVVVDSMDASRMQHDFGKKWADASIQSTCGLMCKIYSEAAVFRVDERRFVAFLQGRNYANRDELFCDFDIWADEINVDATEPWLQVHASKGMATFRPHEDGSVADVLERAIQGMERA